MRRTIWTALVLTLASFALAAVSPGGVKLGSVYGGKLDYEEGAQGRDWTVAPEDVWNLESFSYKLKGKLELELGASVVVFGKHEDDKGRKSVVWAAVIPREDAEHGRIVSSNAGHGNHVQNIFLRFHPGLVAKLFPAKTVLGQGDPLMAVWGKRIYAHKINSHWQSENMPVVPWKQSLVFDIETVEGVRRCYMLDTKKKTAEYVGGFANRTIPDPPSSSVDSNRAFELFDGAWSAFDSEYAMFGVKPNVDWNALRELYRPIAASARTNYEVGGVIGMLLAHLEDLHISVTAGGEWLQVYNRMRPHNSNWNEVKSQVEDLKDSGLGIAWGQAPSNIGYINIWNLSSGGLSDAFDDALEGLGRTRGLILDLRFNGGGDEALGRRIAGRFADKEFVYSISRYREGGGHDELGPELPRKLEPRGPWRYEAPVVVLIGQRTMSSAESLALMLAGCPEVTTMGDRTAGSSGNPRSLELGEEIVIRLPRWLDLDPDGNPIDAVGVAPMKPVEASSKKGGDPVFSAALALAKKTKSKLPGKR